MVGADVGVGVGEMQSMVRVVEQSTSPAASSTMTMLLRGVVPNWQKTLKVAVPLVATISVLWKISSRERTAKIELDDSQFSKLA